jgi:hypothetical protein
MLFSFSFFSILEVLLVIVPALLSVAYVTVAERKTMASMQRRVGPNKVGVLGLLQAFADALKLILKEYVSPTQANLILFFLGPAEWFGKLLKWEKLSNSGNLLKLLIPSASLKGCCGWANHLCMVISQKMIEREMDNRGSKLITGLCTSTSHKSGIVKEQRVNGSWRGVNTPRLRYTLMGFERNYQVKILSKQINKYISYTSRVTPQLQIQLPRDPYLLNAANHFVSGFTPKACRRFICNFYSKRTKK